MYVAIMRHMVMLRAFKEIYFYLLVNCDQVSELKNFSYLRVKFLKLA